MADMFKVRGAMIASALVILAIGFCAATATATPPRRSYALIVANNASVDEGVEALRYADDDGARFYELFERVADETRLLTTLDSDSQRVFPGLASKTSPPTFENLRDQVARLAKRLAQDREAGVETELYLVFTGHGNVDAQGEGYLSLADRRLRRSDLYREVIRPLDATYTHLVIDACHAYFMVRSRGGNEGEWEDDRSGETLDDELTAYLEGRKTSPEGMRTVGVILSTAGAAEVHEWSKFRSGVFSHQLRSGMLGAADADGDGAVTYRELEAYLVAANVAVTNPRAKIRVFAQPPEQDRSRPLVRLGDYRDVATLEIPRGVGGRYYVEDARGLRYADMHVDPSAATKLVLLRHASASPYFLRTANAQAELDAGKDQLRSTRLAFVAREDQARGSVEEAFRSDLFAMPFGPGFVQGYVAGRENGETLVERRARDVSEDSWQVSPRIEYAAGAPLYGLGGLQHQLGLSLSLVQAGALELGPYLGYGLSSHREFGTVHRLSGGLETLYLHRFRGGWSFGPRLRFGHQAVFVDRDRLYGDPVGVRFDAALVLAVHPASSFGVQLAGGASADVVTEAHVAQNVEHVFWNPYAAVGLRF